MNIHELMDLKEDYAFKQLFGNQKNSRILITFLNALLQRTLKNRIIAIQLENTELSREYQEDKMSRLDLLATTDDQSKVNIEIQFTDRHDMVNRTLFYWSRIYSDQMQKGDAYGDLHKTVVINILNFNLLRKETNQFHTTFHLYEDDEKFKLTDTIEVHFVEMRKLLVQWKQRKLNPRDDILARWLLLLGTVDSKNETAYEDIYKELEVIAMNDDILKEAFASWESLSQDKKARAEYEARLKFILDEAAVERRHEKQLKEAETEGAERGRAEGAMEERIKTAKSLLSQEEVDIDLIVTASRLSKDKVLKIRKDMGE